MSELVFDNLQCLEYEAYTDATLVDIKNMSTNGHYKTLINLAGYFNNSDALNSIEMFDNYKLVLSTEQKEDSQPMILRKMDYTNRDVSIISLIVENDDGDGIIEFTFKDDEDIKVGVLGINEKANELNTFVRNNPKFFVTLENV